MKPRATTGARVTGPAYREALWALVGDANPLAIMEALPSELSKATDGIANSDLRRSEAPGKWSILEVVEHLADAELVHAYRVRMILTTDRPHLAGYDQDLFARRFHYNDGDLTHALSVLAMLRDCNLRVLRTATETDLDRVGLHGERGPESVRDVIMLTAGHDLAHRRQIGRIKEHLGLR